MAAILVQIQIDLKKALVRPLLKKRSLEPILKNYRPVSNLPFIGKLMERCVIEQLMDHIHANNLMEPLQSAYKSYHSTQTALLKVKARNSQEDGQSGGYMSGLT